jgi:uncharacterized membrane protein
MMKRLFDLANLALLGLMGMVVAAAYPRLPDRIPMHFDFAGQPDRWSGRGGLIVLAALAVVMTGVLYGIIRLTTRWAANPRYLNIPRKEEFLRLGAEKQAAYWAVYREFFAGLAAAVNLLFYLILRGTVRIAEGSAGLLPFKLMVPALVAMALVVGYYGRRLIVMPGRLIRGDE